MPALPPVPNVFKVALSGTIGPYDWAVILHCAWSGTAPSVANCNAFAAALEAIWVTDMVPILPTDVVLTKVVFTDLTSSSGAVGDWSGSEAGSTSGAIVGANSCVLVNYPVSTRYRGGHGRSYLPSLVSADLADSAHWASSAITTVNTKWALVLAYLFAGTEGGCSLAGQVIVSYVSKAITPTPPYRRVTPVTYPVAAGAQDVVTEIASQRRRIGRK